MRWLNANAFRTSHYPYAEETLEFADEFGIVVIDETPAVGSCSVASLSPSFSAEWFAGMQEEYFFSNATLGHHINVLQEMVSLFLALSRFVFMCVLCSVLRTHASAVLP
jgi:beta-glucuronidase